jgi:hypothetical protein
MGLIDRGKENDILIKLNLIEYTSEKHDHDDPVKLTSFGKKFRNWMELTNKFIGIEQILLTDTTSFEQSFNEIFLSPLDAEYFVDYSTDEALSFYGLPPIGAKKIKNNTSLTILGWKYHSTKEAHEYEFKLSIHCGKCKNDFEFIQLIFISEEEYRPYDFEIICPTCKLGISCNSIFQHICVEDS